MPFSHHSHSGQFCSHGANTLEQMVQTAIAKKMSTFCLTEHIPRDEVDFYPEEAKVHSRASLDKLYDDFYREARRLQADYAGQIQILIGFEGEWIRQSSLDIIRDLLSKYPVDLFVGSVHHVHAIPIDYDTAMYHRAREIAGGSDDRIFEDYFDSQFEMLRALRPPVVGHFDLIRLKSDDPDRSLRTWPTVWAKIERNLEFIAGYGGILELNSSSLRKGMSEAYPQSEICKARQMAPRDERQAADLYQVFKDLGGGFTLSDDSHGIDQVAMNYDRTWSTVVRAGISELHCLAPTTNPTDAHDARFPEACWKRFPADTVRASPFFLAS